MGYKKLSDRDIERIIEMTAQGMKAEAIAADIGITFQTVYKYQGIAREDGKLPFRSKAKKDCFGYKSGRCTALHELLCRYGECSFYKPKEVYEAEQARYGGEVSKASMLHENTKFNSLGGRKW